MVNLDFFLSMPFHFTFTKQFEQIETAWSPESGRFGRFLLGHEPARNPDAGAANGHLKGLTWTEIQRFDSKHTSRHQTAASPFIWAEEGKAHFEFITDCWKMPASEVQIQAEQDSRAVRRSFVLDRQTSSSEAHQ